MFNSPNFLYYLVLFCWPFFAYRLIVRWQLDRAVLLMMLIPYLFLPVPHPYQIMKLPLLPALDKESIPILALLFALYLKKIKLDWFPSYRLSGFFCAALLLSPFFTVFTNMQPLNIGERSLPGLQFTESLSLLTSLVIKVYVPFVVGYSLLASEKSHEELIKLMFVLGLIYSVLMLYEVRMSPQLHTKFYGFFPHDWRQQIRAGGFRPVVFLGHGLLVALYGSITAIAAFALWRNKHKVTKGKGAMIFAYCCLVLVLCKTYSAVIYLLFFASLSLFLSEKMRMRALSLIALIVLTFPAIRHQLPLSDITAFFMDLNPDRASSLQYRFDHEDKLLGKANEKPWFGWGTWGRNRIYHPITGEDMSVTDGAWIIRYGVFGWLGYLAAMGLLAYPIIAFAKAMKSHPDDRSPSPYTPVLCAILAIYLIDQIPNASLSHLTYLIAGAVLGGAKQLSEAKRETPRGTAAKADLVRV
jgi:hypothetical protein